MTEIENFSNALRANGILNPLTLTTSRCLNENEYSLIGIYSKNRYEWIVSQYSLYRANGALVPFYEALSGNDLK